MEKQPPSEAAMSSSGLVPMPLAKRVLKEYCVSARTPLSVLIVPEPCRRLPRQTAEAWRFKCGEGWFDRWPLHDFSLRKGHIN